MEYQYEQIDRQLDTVERVAHKTVGASRVKTRVKLDRGDRAWNPASTKDRIPGPAIVEYTRYPDGGIDAEIVS